MQKLQGWEERSIKVLEEKGSSLHTVDGDVLSAFDMYKTFFLWPDSFEGLWLDFPLGKDGSS